MFVRPPIGRPFPPRGGNNQPPEQQQPDGPKVEDVFYPGLLDVLKVRHILLWKVKPEGLPTEVVDMIVDAGEYWPSNEFTMGERRVIRKDVDEVLLCTTPLCYDEKTLDTPLPKVLPHRTIHPGRKIQFSIVSHDQGGWNESQRLRGNNSNVYNGSWTWFDSEIIHKAHETPQKETVREKMSPEARRRRHFGPDDPDLLPGQNALQRNRARIQQPQRHIVVWHYLDDIAADSPESEELERSEGRGRNTLAGKQVRELEPGDSIMVWARARFPGWINYVNELSVRVFWAV
ncbi:hypothetical protein ASPCAL11436 [Aspergillus calidoustus]|uniref:Uncharacterized protein n=1 Tax=Aspergillus calidoustus TaxID=454130 RepID=A0A0U5GBA2_ASPCI|nr:hypothetical protein ASPCAL11436 [Aspergillus calidoustus]